MLPFAGRGILLDIEGTTSSISFVYDVMFPFVRRELGDFVHARWGDPDLIVALQRTASDLGHESLSDWCAAAGNVPNLCGDVLKMMDDDVKATGLKQLQGLVWEAGYKSGELVSHVYDDLPPALKRWNAAGRDVRIYSSGSVQAQKLFFGHTAQGDLLPLFRGHYDTTTGPKKEAASYTKIAVECQLPPGEILFLSDVIAELAAAKEAGLKTALVKRPGNAAIAPGHEHDEIESFENIP
jgi:enolase-phosphatase E1